MEERLDVLLKSPETVDHDVGFLFLLSSVANYRKTGNVEALRRGLLAASILCLKGKVALVTGASYDIGFAIASAYAEAGAVIVFNDINQELFFAGCKDEAIAEYVKGLL